MTGRTFEELVAEGDLVPVEGWDFSWFEGRASEARPSWGYARGLVGRMAAAGTALDIQTGGGEVLAEVLSQVPGPPARLAATEAWPPNLALARDRLRRFGAEVVAADEDGDLPFPDGSFDLVVSRHPTVVVWDEVARVLRPGGTYLSQQIGAGSNRELYEYLMGPQPEDLRRSPERTRRHAEAAGLVVVDLRAEALRVTFDDIAAVVYFLRKVVWTVPGFTTDAYRDRLAGLHAQIERHGPFVAHSQRMLVEARKPA